MHEENLEQLDSSTLLSPTIKLLGDILGEVIVEQAGKDCFELEERIRLLSKSFREKNDLKSVILLQDEIANLNPSQRIIIIRSFSLFFQLVNLAEEDFRIRVNKIQETAIHDERTDTLRYAIQYASNNGVSLENLLSLLVQLNLRLVTTAHPSESRRLTILMKLREIYSLLQSIERHKIGSIQYNKIRNKIKEQVTLLWQSDDLRENKIEVLDEVRTNLFYFENTIFDVLPKLFEDISLLIKEVYKKNIKSIDFPVFLDFGSWVGSDRDGHPYVTSSVTIQALLLQKRLCLRKYHKSVKILLRELSSSLNLIDISNELQKSLERDSEILPESAKKTERLNRLEPYRRKLDFMRIKLENTLMQVEKLAVVLGLGQTLVGFQEGNNFDKNQINYYQDSEVFLEELRVIDQSLRRNKGGIIADGKLTKLINQVKIFGFHLAPLDIRQDSEVHLDTIDEIFSYIGMLAISQLSFENRREILRNELINQRPLGVISIRDKLSNMAEEVISTLEIVKNSIQIISSNSVESYIVSMARDESDIYTLMLLMKEVGLLTIDNGKVMNVALDLVPLFETKDDLENAPKIMERLFSDPLYRSLLSLRSDIQEIMIGYSDSTKDVGVLESNYLLITAQRQLVEVAKQFNIQLRIFHGRGGSISRGGGPTNKSILSQPLGSIFQMKITEQGEVIGSNYSNPGIAYRHLEQITSAMIIRAVRDTTLPPEKNPANPPIEYLETYNLLANQARITYENLVKKDPNFIKFYLEFTPLDLIERVTIGSRPSRRTGKKVKNISGLRAIPWIFSWMQSRFLFPGFFGVGSAFKAFEDEFGIDKLQELYLNWPYFESLVNNLQMVTLKADMDIAKQYLALVQDQEMGKTLFDIIKNEYELTKEMILKTTGFSDLMDNTPNIQKSIIRRNPYIDPLSLIQVKLLKLWRKNNRPEDLSPTGLQRALLQTVNGIAAGLRNTG